MKPIYKCEYCNFLGTSEEVQKHEETCEKGKNVKQRNCLACKNKEIQNLKTFKCKAGKEIPEGQMFINCDLFDMEETPLALHQNPLFGGFF